MWLCVPDHLGWKALSHSAPLFLSLATAGWTRGPFVLLWPGAETHAHWRIWAGGWRLSYWVPVADATRRDHMSIRVGGGVQAVGKRNRSRSAEAGERRMDGWEWLERGTNSCPHLWDPREGGLVATCPLLASTCRGLCSCPQKSWLTSPGLDMERLRADLHLIQLLSPEAHTTAACPECACRNQSHLPALKPVCFCALMLSLVQPKPG